MGNTDIVELLDEARKARTRAASGAQDLKAAAESSAVGGAAALDKAAAAGAIPGGANRAAAEREDPKKSCWLCHNPEHAVELRVCSGCHKVRLFTPKFIL